MGRLIPMLLLLPKQARPRLTRLHPNHLGVHYETTPSPPPKKARFVTHQDPYETLHEDLWTRELMFTSSLHLRPGLSYNYPGSSSQQQ